MKEGEKEQIEMMRWRKYVALGFLGLDMFVIVASTITLFRYGMM